MEGVAVELEDHALGEPDGVGFEAFDLVVERGARQLRGAEQADEEPLGS